jgi:hypothetical protein
MYSPIGKVDKSTSFILFKNNPFRRFLPSEDNTLVLIIKSGSQLLQLMLSTSLVGLGKIPILRFLKSTLLSKLLMGIDLKGESLRNRSKI